MSSLRVLCRENPRTIALVKSDSVLLFRHAQQSADAFRNAALNAPHVPPRCLVEFASKSSVDLRDYRLLGEGHGTLGVISKNSDVFVCVVTGSSRAALVRPGETVLRIDNVEFYCLNRSDYDYAEHLQSTASFAAEEEDDYDTVQSQREIITDHPFLALKKLLSDGSFYYSVDFNLTERLQDRSNTSAGFDIEGLDQDMLWNSYMIAPLLQFRSRLAAHDKARLDASDMLTTVIRGFAGTMSIPASVSPVPHLQSDTPSTLTVISRLSSRRAGTRFNSRGIDDDGFVANFVETETVLWCPPGFSFSYVQIRGSVPVFWEQSPGLLPGQQKIEIARSFEATRHAFEKHFESLELNYGAVHTINLLSEEKTGEAELSARFRRHIADRSKRQQKEDSFSVDHNLSRLTEYDFHAETRGAQGYEASNQIRHIIWNALVGFGYFLSDDSGQSTLVDVDAKREGSTVVLQQEGVFRTNCLDCLDRTNLVQTIISLMALELCLHQYGGRIVPEIQMRHATLWADNGDALSKIYAGTGALKSSFTRHGKMSLAGAIADVRKSATRLYVNNFADKARQNTIDMLLGRLPDQVSVDLYDPVNDIVSAELNRRIDEYTSSKTIKIWTGTFNLNGRSNNFTADLSPWLLSQREKDQEDPAIVAVAFQEIVQLSPQQIMSTDPGPRIVWEEAVRNCLNSYAERYGKEKYVLLRSGQLVGAALLLYVRADVLGEVKNVEGSVKKTGLSGMAGNKGGCAIRLDMSSTRLCFVTAHLAAGASNFEERNRDYETISHGLRFLRNKTIDDHDTIIWFGDFNYRIDLPNQEVRELAAKNQLDTLLANDQLNLQMMAGKTFPSYLEGPITFPPTYKYDVGSDEYDTSEKARTPAWCDRVLWKGRNLRQTYYNTADLKISDHRPVVAQFECTIRIVNEQARDQLRRQLYERRRSEMKDLPASRTLVDLSDDSEELVDTRPTAAPGGRHPPPPVPAPRRAKTLEQGKGFHAEPTPLKGPRLGKTPTSTLTDDWVHVPNKSAPAPPPPRLAKKKPVPSATTETATVSTPHPPPRSVRSTPEPGPSSASTPRGFPSPSPSPSPVSVPSAHHQQPIQPTSTTTSSSSISSQKPGVSPPPIPRKPVGLRAPPSSSPSTPVSITAPVVNSGPQLPQRNVVPRKPPLPPRRTEQQHSPTEKEQDGNQSRSNGSAGDDLLGGSDAGASSIDNWKPLLPSR